MTYAQKNADFLKKKKEKEERMAGKQGFEP
jgi:hypothetical protein